MSINDVSIGFLLLSMFFPRLTLFGYWLFNGLPFNTTPIVGDFFGAIFLPRILILIWLWDINGGASDWFWIHFVAMIIAYVVNYCNISNYIKQNS